MRYFDTDFGPMGVSDDTLGKGGRGKVLPVMLAPPEMPQAKKKLVLKQVEGRWRTEGRQRKVACLERMGRGAAQGKTLPAGCAVAWPVTSAYEEGRWIGFAMRAMEGRPLDAVKADGAIAPAVKVRQARRACELVSALHAHGVVLGDVSLSNFMYDEAHDRLALVDIDSAQVADEATGCIYPTTESREKSPEMLAGRMGEVVLTSRSDDFLVAVEVFRLLFDAHPLDEYAADVSPAEMRARNATARRFGFANERRCCGPDAFGRELGNLFRRTFEGPYELIPNAADYAACLSGLERQAFETCPVCGQVRVAVAEERSALEVAPSGLSVRRVVGGLGFAAGASVMAFACCACMPELAGFAQEAAGFAQGATAALDGAWHEARLAADAACGQVQGFTEGAWRLACDAAEFAQGAASAAQDAWESASPQVEVALSKAAELADALVEGVFDLASNAWGWLEDALDAVAGASDGGGADAC